MESNPVLTTIYEFLIPVALAKAAILSGIVGYRLFSRSRDINILFAKSFVSVIALLSTVILYEYAGVLANRAKILESVGVPTQTDFFGLVRIGLYAIAAFVLFFAFDRLVFKKSTSVAMDCLAIFFLSIFVSLVSLLFYTFYFYHRGYVLLSDVSISFLIGGFTYLTYRFIKHPPFIYHQDQSNPTERHLRDVSSIEDHSRDANSRGRGF